MSLPQPDRCMLLERYLALGDRLGLRQGLPYVRDWSAAPDFLELIVAHVLAARPAAIVECGSGLTTLMLARCCELNARGCVHSLEHGAEYAARTRQEIARYGLDAHACVIEAPLETHVIHGRTYQWYALAALPAAGIELLVIDGPPGPLQPHARYPALPLLLPRLAEGCTVFLDDAARPDEREIVESWRAEFPAIEYHDLPTERGCSVLRIHGG